MTYTVTIHDRLAGDYLLDGEYEHARTAHSAAKKRCEEGFHAISYTVACGSTKTTETVLVGYEMYYAVRDLRCFCDTTSKRRLAGWNMNKEGFRLLVDKGYIVPSADHLSHEAGYWEFTERAKKLGRFLRKRFKFLMTREYYDQKKESLAA